VSALYRATYFVGKAVAREASGIKENAESVSTMVVSLLRRK